MIIQVQNEHLTYRNIYCR